MFLNEKDCTNEIENKITDFCLLNADHKEVICWKSLNFICQSIPEGSYSKRKECVLIPSYLVYSNCCTTIVFDAPIQNIYASYSISMPTSIVTDYFKYITVISLMTMSLNITFYALLLL